MPPDICMHIVDKMNPCLDDVIKWKHFPRNWSFVRGIHRSPVNSAHKGQWRGAFMFSLIYVWIIGWVNNREAGDLRRQRAHYDVIVMVNSGPICCNSKHHVLHNPYTIWYILKKYFVYEQNPK